MRPLIKAPGQRGRLEARSSPKEFGIWNSGLSRDQKPRPRVLTLVAWALRYNKAFVEACNRQNLAAAQELLEKGADIDATRDGETALRIAAYRGYLSVVRWLIGRGATADLQDALRRTALQRVVDQAVGNSAELQHRMDIVEFLLAAGADINSMTSRRLTPLHIASLHGSEEIVRLLLSRGAVKRKEAMLMAASNGRAKLVQVLFEYGVAGEDPKGTLAFPLREAVIGNHKAVIQQLLESGADANTRARDGHLILYHALVRGFDDIATLLIQNGAVLLQDYIYVAVHSGGGCLQALREQVKRGGLDFNKEDSFGRTPLQITEYTTNRQLRQEMKSFLIEHRATEIISPPPPVPLKGFIWVP